MPGLDPCPPSVGRFLLVTAALVSSCDSQAYPWEAPGPAPTVTAPPRAPADDSSAPVGPEEDAVGPRGGLFKTCADGLEAEVDPIRDVTRLVTTCAQPTGMTRVFDAPLEGAVAKEGPAVVFDFQMVAGHCYRLFAVASPGINDLGVEVRSSRGTLVASDHRHDRIAIVQPDRPFCSLADDAGSVVVSAVDGSGSFALELASFSAPRH